MALNYYEFGDTNAQLMVFLHGGGVSSWMWDKQVEYFTNYHCVTIDLPEHGQNKHLEEFSINYSADEVIQLIETIADGKEIIVMGFSLGAQVLVQMLSVKPNLIDYAIINSALVRPSKSAVKMISPLIKCTYPLMKNRTFSKLQAKALFISDNNFEKYYNETLQMKSDTLVRILKENMSFAIPPGFNKATGKILVTVGEKEQSMMKKSAYDIVHDNQNCEGMIISGIGHGMPLVKPDLFNQMVEEWIRKGSVSTQGEIIG